MDPVSAGGSTLKLVILTCPNKKEARFTGLFRNDLLIVLVSGILFQVGIGC